MNRSMLSLAVLGSLATACGEAPAPVLTCPESFGQVECVDPAGLYTPIMSPADFGVSATVEGGGDIEITCTPEIDSNLRPGEYAVDCTARTAEGQTASCEFNLEAVAAPPPFIECPEAITQACTGPLTEVSPANPTVTDPCPGLGNFSYAVSANVSIEGGLPVGTTTVEYAASNPERGQATPCELSITITDEVPPELSCEGDITVVRESSDAPIEGFGPEAMDNCAEPPMVTADMEITERGSYTVRFTATDDAGLTSECDTNVIVLDVFAPSDPRILSARRNDDGTTRVTLGFEPSAGEDTDRYALQSSTTPDGPWRDVRYVAADAQTVTDPHMDEDRLFYRIQSASGAERGGATRPIAAFAITNGAYDIRNQSVPNVPFRTTLYGVLHHPVDLTEPRPLVLMLHGNHGICRPSSSYADICSSGDFTNHECQRAGYTTTPNAEGMLYLTETLAAQGYIAVTISGNAMNCRNDFIRERTALLLEHIRRWKSWNESEADPFGDTFRGAVDLARVGMVGHSRGGEAVAGAPQALAATPIEGVNLGSVFSIAPVDFHDPVPTDTHFAVLLPSCDGDVFNLAGRDIYDRSLTPEDPHARAQVLMARANHNYYNTEWRLNDNSRGFACNTRGQVAPIAQQGMLEATLGSWFAATLGSDGFEPFMRSEEETPGAIDTWARTDLDLRWSFRSSERVLIDDLLGSGRPDTNDLGEANSFDGFSTSSACTGSDCSGTFGHDKGAVRLRWRSPGATATFETGTLMSMDYTALSFRIASANDSRNSGITEQRFDVIATDAEGRMAAISNAELIRVPHLYYSRRPLELLQTVRMPLSRLMQANPEFDPATISSLSVRFSGGADEGAVFISDVELASDN